MKVNKVGYTIRISDEVYFEGRGHQDERFRRRSRRTEVRPSADVWARYYAAVAGLRALEAYEWTMFGGPDYGTEVPEPSVTYEYEYLETIDEWLARCRCMPPKPWDATPDTPRPTHP